MEFSPQQQEAITKSSAWLNQCNSERNGLSQPYFYLAGYAGTGKSTLAEHLSDLQNGPTCYGAFTGKAANVMRDNGCIDASTIHSLIYKFEGMEEIISGDSDSEEHKVDALQFEWNRNGPCSEAGLIIIDECSMVDEVLARDLLRYKKPILVLGDPGQLPPIGDAGYFIKDEPDAMLTEIHRQAAGSPIVQLATDIRNGNFDRSYCDKDGLLITNSRDDIRLKVEESDAIIVGKNKTRNAYNDRRRLRLGYNHSPYPLKGETLICLKNDKDKKIFNGEIWEVAKGAEDIRVNGEPMIKMVLVDPENSKRKISVKVHKCFFDRTEKPHWSLLEGTQHFDFGYVLTCHKAQGSQYDNVVVFDESKVFKENADRWLYTACTRAAKNLTLVL